CEVARVQPGVCADVQPGGAQQLQRALPDGRLLNGMRLRHVGSLMISTGVIRTVSILAQLTRGIRLEVGAQG
ncbi:MAG TPA: hypothetical protein H9800_02815, partial [Candidatus Microbacterium stercoravium]|nr:hypothetical protein [Candidatus Microbacterium stercoravium]